MTPQPGLWYAAAKYSCWDAAKRRYYPEAEEANFRLACIRAARLIDAGWKIIAPVPMTHPIHMSYSPFLVREEHTLWYELDNFIIETVPFSGIILPPEWRSSDGCWKEKERFENLGRKVLYFHEPCEMTEQP